MLQGPTVLLLFQCAGEVIVHGVNLPFPGPVLGMLLEVLALAAVVAIATGIICSSCRRSCVGCPNAMEFGK